jgi:hypothetical protein
MFLTHAYLDPEANLQPAVAPAQFHPVRLNFASPDLHKRLCLPSAHVASSLNDTSRPAPLTDGRKPPANTLSHCSSDEISRYQNIIFASNGFSDLISPAIMLHTLVSKHDHTRACMSSTTCYSVPPASRLFQARSSALPPLFCTHQAADISCNSLLMFCVSRISSIWVGSRVW